MRKIFFGIVSLIVFLSVVSCSLTPTTEVLPDTFKDIETSLWTENTIEASSTYSHDILQLENGQVRQAYRLNNSNNLVERILVGNVWSAPTVISTSGCDPKYLQLENGDLYITYKRISNGNLVWRLWNGSSWNPSQVISTNGEYPTIVEHGGVVRCAYKYYPDGYLVERIYNGTSWSTANCLESGSGGYVIANDPEYILRSNGELRISYTLGSDSAYYLVERILVGANWSTQSTITANGSAQPCYLENNAGQLEIVYVTYPDLYVARKIYSDITGWSNETHMIEEAGITPSLIQLQNNEYRFYFVRMTDEYLIEKISN